MHGHGPSLVPVPAVCVTEFGTGRMWWLGSADRFKGLGVALKARVVSVRTRASLLYFWLTVEPVTSVQRLKRD